MKGVSEPVEVFEVTGLGPLRTRLQRAASRGYTKFVGRARELEALRHAADHARQGHGQIVAAIGEPGVGKSRLLFEFKAVSQSGWMVLETVSVSHEKASAYLPLIDLLHGYFKISSDDDLRTRREKVNGRVLTLDRALENTLPLLFGLLGVFEGDDSLAQMDAQVKKRRTLDAIKSILLRESLNQPLMVIFEDLHWIDEQTQEFLNLLADSIGTAKILLLVNYRPEYSHQWGSKTYYTQLRLDPLGKESADEMLSARLGDLPELAPLKQLVLERTEGNPLFIEELVEALFEDGVLVKNGTVKVTSSLNQVKIPATVQGILAARIDRLAPGTKELLQTLAVIGMEFPLSLVRQVIQMPPDQLDRMLGDLQTVEFIYEQPAAGDVDYTFKHALTRDVAYNSLLLERRKAIHGCIGAAIETLYSDSLDEHLANLAYHYRRSQNADKAIDYLTIAGERAAGRSAIIEAETNFHAGVDLLNTLTEGSARDRAELRIEIALGAALSAQSWSAREKQRALERARLLCERLNERTQMFLVLWHLGESYIGTGQLNEAVKTGDYALSQAEQLDDPLFVMAARHLIGEASLWKGDLQMSLQRRRGIAATETHNSERAMRLFGIDLLSVISESTGSVLEQLIGNSDRALRTSASALARAQEANHPYSIAFSRLATANLHQLRRDYVAALENARAAQAVCSELGFTELSTFAQWLTGEARWFTQHDLEGIDDMAQAADTFCEKLSAPCQTWVRGTLAAAYASCGRIEDALREYSWAAERIEQTNERFYEAELIRSRAEQIGGPAAEGELGRAISIACQQGARWWELRATVSLARLLRDTGRRDEARPMLAEVYNWFTEGFDTADLKEANALLDELSLSETK